jgi:hypothetical protein
MSWARVKPDPVQSADRNGLDSEGRANMLSFRRWVWLIGMSGASDGEMMMWAQSFAFPPSLEIRGGRGDFDSYVSERRALRLHVQDRVVKIRLKPWPVAMNPVFELLGAPDGRLTVNRDGAKLGPDKFAWDGRTLWLNAVIDQPTDINLEFNGPPRRIDPASGQP